MPGRTRVTERGLTLQQETFCGEFFKNGGNGEAAYRAAYKANAKRNESWVRVEASKLLKQDKIKARIAELQETLREETLYDAKAANRDFARAFALAEKLCQPAAMVSAAVARCKLNGLIVDASKAPQKSIADMSREELIEGMKTAAAELGFAMEPVRPAIASTSTRVEEPA